MKKIILILSFLMFSLFSVHARINFGIKGGANFSYQDVSVESVWLDQPSIAGFHAGLTSSITLPFFGLGIQFETLFSQKGGVIRSETQQVRTRANYIDIPLYFRWGYDFPMVRPYVGLGPYLSFLVHQSFDRDASWLARNVEEKLRKTDFGFGVIIGVEVINRFRIDLSYQLGCRNLYDGTWDLDMKNRNLSLSLAYFLF